ncbi:hypothetical protein BC03BB108_B0042 (plasmid) [Bacillus cereus 03BB108]|nr:hypothetical protein BC03BB108_B0042 [Bacillus cereus 03BB108]
MEFSIDLKAFFLFSTGLNKEYILVKINWDLFRKAEKIIE